MQCVCDALHAYFKLKLRHFKWLSRRAGSRVAEAGMLLQVANVLTSHSAACEPALYATVYVGWQDHCTDSWCSQPGLQVILHTVKLRSRRRSDTETWRT